MRVTILTALRHLSEAKNINGPARIVTMITKTNPKLNKSHRETGDPCPYLDGITRIAERYGIIGACYENCVNNQRIREGQPVDKKNVLQYFEAQSLWNGKVEHVPDNPYLVRHKDSKKLYLCFKPRQNESGNIVKGVDRYYDTQTGRELTEKEVKDLPNYLPLIKPSKLQEVEKEVFWRVIDINNILVIKCGQLYEIAH